NSLYDKLSGHATAKNNLVVANGQDASIAGDELVSLSINSSSSEGPTDDYRIKPDITGNGTGVYSTYETADDAYNSISGTSMASPNVCGTLLLLQQHYNNINGSFMRAATLKGLALHTADDAGTTGPDAVFGWGLLDSKDAARTITNNSDETLISELTLNNGDSYTIDAVSDGLTDLVVSISWTDPAGTANSGTNSSTPALVNDLDLRVTQGASTYYPYRLTSTTTNSNAGDNTVDPYEKIIIPDASGTYTINVTHKGTLASSQNYSLIVTGRVGTPASPRANFNANNLTPVETTETVNFYDLSDEIPTSWSWSFSPSTLSYVDGTYATSQNLKVRFNATGLYEVTLTVTNAQGTDSEVKTDYINVISNCSHCYSWGSADYGGYDFSISNVNFNTINKSSGTPVPTDANGNRYSDYTATSTDVTAGSSYDLSVDLYAGDSYKLAAIAWIDWNQDCDFDDPGEEYDLGTKVGNGTTSGSPVSITVPSTAVDGNTIMRVSCNYDSPGCSCETGLYGEVEDYIVNVINDCGTPSNLTAASITASSADLFWINNSDATNWDIEWGTTPYTFTGIPDENDVTSNPYSLSGLSVATSYDFYVRADCGADNTNVSDWAGPYNFTTKTMPPAISGVDVDDFYKDKG
ncbi:MAG: S8 family serine peptidase, partial [Chlamydiia bacterium]|nr:S8 family serine peptidase [Chlamydiia bacterium]